MPAAPEHAPLLAAAIEATATAARVTRWVQHDGSGPQRIVKADQSPVTIADFAAQAVVARTLHGRLGPVRLVGEESSTFLRSAEAAEQLREAVGALRASGAWPDATPSELVDAIDLGSTGPIPDDGFWTVDPIDGTKGFLRGHQYCVCLAYIRNGQPVVGVLCCPNLSADFHKPFNERDSRGTLYFAAAGGGAWVVPADEPSATPQPVAGPLYDPGRPAILTESVSTGHSDRSAFAAVCTHLSPPGRSLHLDSQCKYAVVARGQAHGYLRIPPSASYQENIWDHAPGILLTREAGCATSDILARPLDFSRPKMSGTVGLIAAPPKLHDEIVQACREARPAAAIR